MSQQAFFSTAGSAPIGQHEILDPGLCPVVTSIQFPSGSSTSVLYQSTGTPTFYTTTGAPFHGAGSFLPSQSSDERKEYLAVISSGLHLSTGSGLIPANMTPSLGCTSSHTETPSSVTQLTPIALSHVQLAPVQVGHELPSDNRPILYEQYYVDQQDPSTSNVLDDSRHLRVDDVTQPHLPDSENDRYELPKDSNGEQGSLVESDVSEPSSLQAKRMRQAEAARQRYQRMTPDARKEVNARRTLAQKRKRQRDKEVEELEDLLRESKDIEDDPKINEQLREKRVRARRAEAARQRYQRMSEDERKVYNQRRRMRQMGLQGVKKSSVDESRMRQHVMEQNAKKAEAARLRYHRMSDDEKRLYNQRRTEAFRRRRMEEEILLSTPAGRISADALNKAQQIMMRNAKRAEAARLRYQRMTPEQRKAYNQKRSSAKKAREVALHNSSGERLSISSLNGSGDEERVQVEEPPAPPPPAIEPIAEVATSSFSEEALCALEKDVVKRTRQANMVLMRQKMNNVIDQLVMVSTAPDGTQTVIPATTTEDGKQVFHIPASAAQHTLDAVEGTSMGVLDTPTSVLKDHFSSQHAMHIAAIPVVALSDQLPESVASQQSRPQIVAVAAPQIMLPQLAELRTVQHSPPVHNDAQQSGHQQHIIVTVQEPQQPVQHQIIVTDLNQPTGMVLSSMSNHSRPRGRPPIYAAAAAALQQQHQQQQHEQQNTVVLLPGGQMAVATEGGASASTVCLASSPRRRSAQRNPAIASPSEVRAAPQQDILAVATAASVGPTTSDLTSQQKLDIQRAKRAERARMRYHNMSDEERRNFNSRRANALRKARLRDEQLCQLAESAELAGGALDDVTMAQVEEAQRRRARRAEAARLKYHRMSSEERRRYNAMRDAQRRQRKREQEATAMLSRQQPQSSNDEGTHDQSAQSEEADPDQSLLYEPYIHYDERIEQPWAE